MRFDSAVRLCVGVCWRVFFLVFVQTIIQGWRLATAAARKVLADSAEDNGANDAKFREDLYNIAK